MTCTHTRISGWTTHNETKYLCEDCPQEFTPKDDRCALGLRGAFDCACEKCTKEKEKPWSVDCPDCWASLKNGHICGAIKKSEEPPWTDKETWQAELNGREDSDECRHDRIGFEKKEDGVFHQKCAKCGLYLKGIPIECPHCTALVTHAAPEPSPKREETCNCGSGIKKLIALSEERSQEEQAFRRDLLDLLAQIYTGRTGGGDSYSVPSFRDRQSLDAWERKIESLKKYFS